MNKIVLITISVVVILGGIAGFMFLSKDGKDMTENKAMDSKGKQNSGTTTFSEDFTGTLKDLVSQGQSMKCTFSQEMEETKTTGTVYVSGENVYADFTLDLPDGTSYDSKMIRKDDYAYMWSPQEPQGSVINITEAEKMSEEYNNNAEQDEKFDINDVDVDYKCSKWKVDNSMFVPPSTIEFVDLNEQMEAITESIEDMGIDCSVCDNVPAGEAQDQCLQALGC